VKITPSENRTSVASYINQQFQIDILDMQYYNGRRLIIDVHVGSNGDTRRFRGAIANSGILTVTLTLTLTQHYNPNRSPYPNPSLKSGVVFCLLLNTTLETHVH